MKMTIDELIKEMEEEYAIYLKETGLDDPLHMKRERKNNPDCDLVCTANEMTLDILRKYQKIEKIYSDYLKYMNPDNLVDRLGEVLEDGNDDR